MTPAASPMLTTTSSITPRVFIRVPTAPGGALSYDALQLLFESVRKAASAEPADISQRLRAVERFEGVTGVMVFEGSPDPRKSVVIVRVQEGKPAFLTRVDP